MYIQIDVNSKYIQNKTATRARAKHSTSVAHKSRPRAVSSHTGVSVWLLYMMVMYMYKHTYTYILYMQKLGHFRKRAFARHRRICLCLSVCGTIHSIHSNKQHRKVAAALDRSLYDQTDRPSDGPSSHKCEFCVCVCACVCRLPSRNARHARRRACCVKRTQKGLLFVLDK